MKLPGGLLLCLVTDADFDERRGMAALDPLEGG
jgi:hypothetical protein